MDTQPSVSQENWNYLQSGTMLDDYVIERSLAHGGFSSVYLARHKRTQVQVAIKEYLPRRLAQRTWNNVVKIRGDDTRVLFEYGRNLFFEEAKMLAGIKHPNIVNVENFFSANATAYMVMTYDYGLTLDKLILNKSLTFDVPLLAQIFRPLLDAVHFIHQTGWLHLDIKPANILLRPDYSPVLLDFGAIQHYPELPGQKTTRVMTRGFSPIEQYHDHARLGPYTDIYAIGASMRACLESKQPPVAIERQEHDTLKPLAKSFKHRDASDFLAAIDWAMAVLPEDRPQSIEALAEAFSAASVDSVP
ncbi:MAG: serine/threonine-protein kinase [Methylococcales bacterium]|nr:serine/threonine-protein kinase [Methylococcales bacterium]